MAVVGETQRGNQTQGESLMLHCWVELWLHHRGMDGGGLCRQARCAVIQMESQVGAFDSGLLPPPLC